MKESVFIGNMKYRRKNTKQSRPSSSTAFLECVIIDSPFAILSMVQSSCLWVFVLGLDQ